MVRQTSFKESRVVMEDIEIKTIPLDILDNNDPETYWKGEEFDGWILDENGNRVFIGF